MDDIIGVTDLRDQLSAKVRMLVNGELDHLVIIRNAKPAAVMISAAEYERLKEAAK